MKRRRHLPLLALALLASSPAGAAEIELLPELDAHLEFSRYAPTETDFVWDSWVGGRATLLRAGATSVYMAGGVETILGSELRTFDANQSNFVLEGGLRRHRGPWTFSGVFHHVSRHLVDRPKEESVDWNMLALRAEKHLSEGGEPRGHLLFGVAHRVKRTHVLYGWEFRAQGDFDVLPAGPGDVYGRLVLRAITETKTAENMRGGFLDFTYEAGWRLRRETRVVHFFVAYEHRNDVYLFQPESRDRALYGFRVGFGANPGW